jgi:hypothetical protein
MAAEPEMKLFFDKQPLKLVHEAVVLYRPEEFASPTRSTVPLLSLLKHGDPIWRSVLEHFGLSDCSVEVHLEFTVNPPQGSGKASHTDVMLIAADQAVAIEAKWTEPRYDEVGVWLDKSEPAENSGRALKTDPSKNRGDVLNGWLSLLQGRVAKKLNRDDFSSAIYQMVHRAASACSAGRLPSLVYLQFCPLPDGRPVESGLMADLRRVHSLLGSPPDFLFWLAKVEAKPNPAFEQIRRLPKGNQQTAEAVRAALRGEPLFTFTGVSILPVKEVNCP